MSDGRFSSKPIRSQRSRDLARSDGAFSTEPLLSKDSARAFLQAPAVQREVNALLDSPFPETGDFPCSPLSEQTPAAAVDLGEPLASAILDQEYLIGLLLLRVVGWICMPIGAMLLLSSFVILLNGMPDRGREGERLFTFGVSVGFGLAFVGIGAWFGYFRGRVITERCWLCPHGMIWLTHDVFDWYRWETIPELFCNLRESRPAIGIRFDRNISWISFSDTPASRHVVATIERHASAACLRNLLPIFAEGKTIHFGTWRLSRSSISHARTETAWENVLDVEGSHREVLFIQPLNKNMAVSLDTIPFPSFFTVLARACFAHTRARTR